MSQEAAKSVVDPLAAYTQAHAPVIARPRSPILSDSMARDALAQTAGHLLSTVQSNESTRDRSDTDSMMDNDKFANSTFLNLMRKLRDGEVVVEGDKVVEQIGPSSSQGEWKGKGRDHEVDTYDLGIAPGAVATFNDMLAVSHSFSCCHYSC